MSKSRANAETLRTALVAGDVTNANFTGADLELGKGGTGSSSAGAARTALGLAIGSDVLAPNGSAANLTNLPASGSEDFVASGTLPNGKPVILKANGQVEVVSGASASTNMTEGSTGTLVSSVVSKISASFTNVSNQIIVTYVVGTNSIAVVGTINSTSISFGTPVTYFTTSASGHQLIFDTNTAGRFVIIYNINSNLHAQAIVGNISNTNVAFGSAVAYHSAASFEISAAYDSQVANKFVVVWRDGENSGYPTAKVGTISGTNSLSFGSETVIASAYGSFPVATPDPFTSKILLWGKAASNTIQSIICTISGTTPTFGTMKTVITSTDGGQFAAAFDPITQNRFVAMVTKIGTSELAFIGTLNGTTLTFSSSITWGASAGYNEKSISFDTLQTGKFAVAYTDATNGNKATVEVGTLSNANALTFSSKTLYTSGTSANNSLLFNPATIGRFLFMYRENSTSTARFRFGQVGYLNTNLTATNFLGTATAAYTNGQTASIMLKGGISDNQTSLTAGSTYFVQPNGTFATTSNANTVLAGEAVSATSLLLNGLATPDEIPSQSGNTGKFLTTNGSAASWGAVSGAGLVLVGSVDASGASTADLTGFSTTYDNFVIEISNLTSTGNSSILRGSLFLNDVHSTGGEYQSSVDRASVSSTTYSRRAAYNTAYWEFSSDSLGPSGKEFGTSIRLFGRNSGLKTFTSSGVGVYGGGAEALARGFLEAGTNPITKIRFSSSAGNITGNFRLYGIKKA